MSKVEITYCDLCEANQLANCSLEVSGVSIDAHTTDGDNPVIPFNFKPATLDLCQKHLTESLAFLRKFLHED